MYNGYRVFPGGKERPGRDAGPSPPSNAVCHERVELYLYSPYGPYGLYRASVPVQWYTLPTFTSILLSNIKFIERRKKIIFFIYNIHLAAPRTLLAGGGRITRPLPITIALPANYLQYLTMTRVCNSQPVFCVW